MPKSEQFLLKFCGAIEYSFRNLDGGVIYCQHYSAYNDPLEFWSCPASAPMRQIGVFSEGRFLVHLSPFRSADETEIRAGESPGRTACERYS
ncbi:hypothetical protein, partial [Methylocapsa palsarum]|uniref:hypothetical protein n=1 Tax=Methylocapsa palsarum TaxID=1612308 RepID=UPI001AECA0B1